MLREQKMCLSVTQQWLLITFALVGTANIIDVFFGGSISTVSLTKTIIGSAITAALYVYLWNIIQFRRNST